MKNVVIVYDGTLYTYKWIKTLMWARDEFKERGYSLHYVNSLAFLPYKEYASKQIDSVFKRNNVDILLIAYHHSLSQLSNRRGWDKIELLKKLRDKCGCIVWLDTADSTGTTQFEVLPYVDFYLKKQLLKDISLYQKHQYGQRIYLDYYNKNYNISDDEIDHPYTLLDPQFSHKIRVSWNIGIADIWRRGRASFLHPYSIKSPSVCTTGKNRTVDVFFNGTIKYSSLTSFQRQLACEMLKKDKIRNCPDPQLKMSHEEYVEYMKNSKFAISPFGWGEVCYRDFEAIVYGATLLKPSVEHMITYPNFYIPEETYIPINWDLSNYDEILNEKAFRNSREIAINAQELFIKHTTTKWGKVNFAEHFIDSIS